MENNSNHAELLKTLLVKCLNDQKRLKEAYERPASSNPFGFKRETSEYSIPILEDVEYFGKSDTLTKHKLDDYEEKPDFLDSLEIKFDLKPALKFAYNSVKTKATKEITRTKKSFEMKTFFGTPYQSEVEICTTTYKLIYVLSHGTIECDISGDEVDKFLKTYHDNVLEVSKKIDLEKLQKRITDLS